jgi:catechol 2,3-dioxygenase-like lactoylglutathione lyase family enzyme
MAVAKLHLSLNVSDIERSKTWYSTLFGVAPHKERPGYANFDVDSPPVKLALNEHAPSTGGSLNHLGILVDSTEEVLAAKTRFEEAGLITFSEENVTCCFAKQDKVWVRDPDGNAWEVYALLDDMTDEHEDHDHVGEATPTACCTPVAEACCVPGATNCCG